MLISNLSLSDLRQSEYKKYVIRGFFKIILFPNLKTFPCDIFFTDNIVAGSKSLINLCSIFKA